jgi:hypothetical protein
VARFIGQAQQDQEDRVGQRLSFRTIRRRLSILVRGRNAAHYGVTWFPSPQAISFRRWQGGRGCWRNTIVAALEYSYA